MTLIIGTSWGGRAAIASDSHGSDGTVHMDYGRKFAELPLGAIGWSGSYRWFPVVRAALAKIDRLRHQADAEAMMDAIEVALKAKGWIGTSEKGMPKCEDVLGVVVSRNRKLWEIRSNLVAYPVLRIAVVGSGAVAGRGIAEALRRCRRSAPDAARETVQITTEYLTTVKGRVHVLEVE